jgi:hypothetical protein
MDEQIKTVGVKTPTCSNLNRLSLLGVVCLEILSVGLSPTIGFMADWRAVCLNLYSICD